MIDENAGDEVRVTVIATGFGKNEEEKAKQFKSNVSFLNKYIQDDDSPAVWRKKLQELGQVIPDVVKVGTIVDGYFNDGYDYDTPTFLRRHAE